MEIGNVQKISVGINTNTFYKVSLDAEPINPDGSTNLLYGNFSIHSKTKIIGQVGVAQTFLDVDSTLGFPKSGTLTFLYENGSTGVCTYANKTVNQFLGINTTGITTSIADSTEIDQNTFAYASDGINDDGIRVKIRGVFSEIEKASEHAKKIQSIDKYHNVFVGEMGKWLAFEPDVNSEAAGNPEYANDQLNSIIAQNV